MTTKETEEQCERRLAREATTICLGTLGDRSGVNVAKVEVWWYVEYSDFTRDTNAGFYYVHATGEEPMIAEAGEFGSIYTVFETLVHEAMQAKIDAYRLDGYEISDIYSA